MTDPFKQALETLHKMDQQAKAAHEEMSNIIQDTIDHIDNWKKENGVA